MTFQELAKSITRQEWQLVIWLAVVLMVLVSAIPVAGFLVQGEDHYNGLQALNPGDRFVYYSYIEQARQGSFLFKDLYASEPGARTLNVFWLGAGVWARIFDLSPVIAMHLARIFMIFIALPIFYLFISYFFSDKLKRKFAFIFLLFSSGLGALLGDFLRESHLDKPGYFHRPFDLWTPEGNVFLSFLTTPHFAAALFFFLLIFLFMLLAWQNNNYRYSLIAGLSGLALFNFHPFHTLSVFAILLVFWLIKFIQTRQFWLYFKHYLIFSLLSAPSILYHLWFLANDFITYQKAQQNICLTPAWYLTIVGFGFLFAGAVIGLYVIFREKKFKEDKWLFIAVWSVVHFFVLYFPVNFQRRMILGLQVPFVLLTILGGFYLSKKIKPRLMRKYSELFLNNWFLGVILFILLFCFSTVFNFSRDFYYTVFRHPWFYLSQDQTDSFSWLKENLSNDDIILAQAGNGHMIPGLTGRIVYLGHGVETPLAQEKDKLVRDFFRDNDRDDYKQEFLKQNKITYIFYGDWEKGLGAYNPASKDYLSEVFGNEEVRIFRVLSVDN